MDGLDAYRCAHILIREHGMQAATRATLRRGELLTAGDVAGAEAWMRIIDAIRMLRRTEREPGEALQ